MQSTLYFGGILALLLFVTLRGSFPERVIVWIIFVSDIADLFYHRIYGPSDFNYIDYTHMVIDTFAFAGVMWVALGANRFWPLPVCSLHLIGFSGHLAVLGGVPGVNQMYWAMISIPDYLQLVVVAAGLVAHARRTKRIGSYRDWRRGWRVPTILQPAGTTATTS